MVHPPLRAVIFDAVGTLIHPEPSVADVYSAIGKRYGSGLSREAVKARFGPAFCGEEAIDAQRQHRTSEAREIERWRRIVGHVLDDVENSEAAFKDLFTHFAQPHAWRVDPAAEPLLHALHARGIRTVLASNFDGRLAQVVAGLPQLGKLHPVVASSAIGWKKPAPEFFYYLLRELRLAANEILSVGDDFENDVKAAQAVGMHAVWLSTNSEPSPRASTVPSLADLAPWLRENSYLSPF